LEDGKNAFAVDFYEMREPSDGAPSSDDDSSLFASPELPRVPIGSATVLIACVTASMSLFHGAVAREGTLAWRKRPPRTRQKKGKTGVLACRTRKKTRAIYYKRPEPPSSSECQN